MKRTCLDTHTILFSCFCQNTDLFILPNNLILDLWGNCEVKFLFLPWGEVNMVWDLYIAYSDIWYFYLYENSLILYFLDTQFHIYDLILLIARSGYDKRDVIEFVVIEFYRIQLQSRNVTSWVRLCIFSLKSDRKRQIFVLFGCKHSHLNLYILCKHASILIGIIRMPSISLNKIHNIDPLP